MQLIDREAFVERKRAFYCKKCDRRKNSKGEFVYLMRGAPCRTCDIGDLLDAIEEAPTVCCENCKYATEVERIGDREYVSCIKPYAGMSNVHLKRWVCGDWRGKDGLD